MAIRPRDKITERELADVVDFKLNYLGNYRTSENIQVKGQHGALQNGEVLTKGTRVHDIIQAMLDDTFERPYKYPTIELTGVEENIESGTKTSFTIVPVFTQNDAGPLTKFRLERSESGNDFVSVHKDEGDLDHIITYTESELIITDSTDISYRVTVWFNEGPIKLENGEEVEGRIEAGSLTTTLTISSIRKCFYGAESGIIFPVENSNQVRALPNSTTFEVEEGSIISIAIPTGTNRITFAYPSSVKDPEKVISKKLGYDIKEVFEKSTIRVKGNNGYADLDYKVFTYIPDTKYPSDDVYTVEI